MIRRATDDEMALVTELACLLWPDNMPEELEMEMSSLAVGGAAFFLAWEEGEAVGFAQCQLRRDYVEGTEHSPVGYLEGIYVKEAFRCRGVAKELLKACEDWARSVGCREFASDCELSNTVSQRFHTALGFREANRIVCFVKKLEGKENG